jgi:hypothetical protein
LGQEVLEVMGLIKRVVLKEVLLFFQQLLLPAVEVVDLINSLIQLQLLSEDQAVLVVEV